MFGIKLVEFSQGKLRWEIKLPKCHQCQQEECSCTVYGFYRDAVEAAEFLEQVENTKHRICDQCF